MLRAAPPVLSTLLNCFASPLATAPHLVPPASAASAPLQGWLVSHKANLCLAGAPTDAGSQALRGYAPPLTATALARCQAAGAALAPASPSSMDEFGMGSATAYGARGAAYSPYSANALLARGGGLDPAGLPPEGWLSPGGSSGGAAAAVACGAAQGALGSDTGGSVRQPAALCGVVGLKPTRGGVSRWGLVAYASSLDTVGVLAPSAQAARALHGVVAGLDGRDEAGVAAGPPWARPRAAQAWRAAAAAAPLAGLRIGLPREYHVQGACPHTLAAWEAAAQAAVRLGAEVVQVALPHTALALPAYYVLAAGEAASNLARYDSVRYGARATAGAGAAAAATAPLAPPPPAAAAAAADALHSFYTEHRSAHLGLEVARRILTGNAILSAASRGQYYEAAAAAAAAVAGDFGAALRAPRPHATPPPPSLNLLALANPAYHTTACAALGCDVLLAPTAPAPPWVSSDTATLPPLQVYLGDVCTVAASLAGLPALSMPWALAPYPRDALQRLLQAWRRSSSSSSSSSTGAGLSEAALEAVLRVPVGVQLIGRHGEEGLLLDVAEALEGEARFHRPAYTLE